jgi:hypothetical protein
MAREPAGRKTSGLSIASGREAVAVRTFPAVFRYFAFWLLEICGTTVNIRNTCCASLPVRMSRSPGAPIAPAAPCGRSPQFFSFPVREQNPMKTTQLPDISVDFMTWLNTELRKRIEADEDSQTRGLVNRLKTYFGRPVENPTVTVEA